MKSTLLFSCLFFSTILFSCTQHADKEEVLDTSMRGIESNPSSLLDKNENKQQIPLGNLKHLQNDTSIIPSQAQPVPNVDWDKKIIKTATVKLEVKDFKKYDAIIHATTRKFGGYIAQEEQNLTDERSETILSIKVPVQQFEIMMNELAVADVKIIERKIASQDVTGEVIDTKSRLEAKRQVRLKYLDFLKESKNMEDVLKVQAEINELQEEIEAAAGRIDYLSHQAAYSTINLSFYQPVNGFKPVDVSPSFFTRVSLAFKTGAQWIADIFVALISIWPLLLIIIGSIFIIKAKVSIKTNLHKL